MLELGWVYIVMIIGRTFLLYTSGDVGSKQEKKLLYIS